MIFDDDTEPPRFRPIPTGRGPAVPLTADGQRIAEANPRWGPKQIEAELRRLGIPTTP